MSFSQQKVRGLMMRFSEDGVLVYFACGVAFVDKVGRCMFVRFEQPKT